MKRKEFLHQCGLGLGFMALAESLAACQEKESNAPAPTGLSAADEALYNTVKGKLDGKGQFRDNNTWYLDLKYPTYATLQNPMQFINAQDLGVLILRLDEKNIKVLDNCCPHLGSRDRWVLQGSRFKCNNHNNVFGIEEAGIAPCGSGATYGNLRSFPSKLIKDLLQITFP